VNEDSTEGRWSEFLNKWKYYKAGYGIKDTEFRIELLECCEKELKSYLFRNTRAVGHQGFHSMPQGSRLTLAN
jgi:hypothetical protein